MANSPKVLSSAKWCSKQFEKIQFYLRITGTSHNVYIHFSYPKSLLYHQNTKKSTKILKVSRKMLIGTVTMEQRIFSMHSLIFSQIIKFKISCRTLPSHTTETRIPSNTLDCPMHKVDCQEIKSHSPETWQHCLRTLTLWTRNRGAHAVNIFILPTAAQEVGMASI